MRDHWRYSLALCVALLPGIGAAEAPGATAWRVDTAASFARYQRAWAAYQLAATTGQYDVGHIVTAAPAPASSADLFSTYRLQPATNNARSFSVQAIGGTTAKVCMTATLGRPEGLEGFLRGVRDSKASLATSDCQPASLSPSLSFPAVVGAYLAVGAVRADALIAKDTAERAAQAAVSDTVTFDLPAGKLLDFTGRAGEASEWKQVVLHNSSTLAWSLLAPGVDGPFMAQYSGNSCDVVFPAMSCILYVSFGPTAVGKSPGHVTVTTNSGKSLVLRLSGSATP